MMRRLTKIRSSSTYHEIKSVAFYALLLILFALIVLPMHASRMFNSTDGSYRLELVHEQHLWMSPFFLGMNLFQGLGDIFIPVMSPLIPVFQLGIHFHGILPEPLVMYTVFSAQYMIGAYLLCRTFKISANISLFSSLGITLLALPLLQTYHNSPLFYAIFSLSPDAVDLFFFSSLLLFLFGFIGKSRLTHSVLLGLLISIVTLYIALTSLTGIILIAPFMLLTCGAQILFSDNKSEFFTKIILIVVLLILLFVTNYFWFIFGLFSYSTAHLLPNTLQPSPNQLGYISSLFVYPVYRIYPATSWVAALGIVGNIITLFHPNKLKRHFAWVFIAYSVIVIGFGLSTVMIPNWYHGPYTIYFEFIIWPLAMGYSLLFIKYAYTACKKLIVKNHQPITKTVTHTKLPILISSLVFVLLITANWLYKDPAPNYTYPPKKTEIVSYLSDKIALYPNKEFKGYEATFLPEAKNNKALSWINQTSFDYFYSMKNFGNDLRNVGLWHYQIPTLFEYSPILSPDLYNLIVQTMARPIDMQMRNIIVFTQPNFNLLAALGVRFIITNSQFSSPTIILHSALTQHTEGPSLYLYELKHYNQANYHPTHFHQLKNDAEFINLINHGKADLSKDIYLSNPITTPSLIQPNYSKLIAIKNGIELRAQSNGTSSVLLPILFSNCLHTEFVGSKPSFFKLVRANIAETLIIFQNNLDVKLTYRSGLLKYAHCRIDDTNDFKRRQTSI